MTKQEAIKFGEIYLEMNDDSKDSDTYQFIKMAIDALSEQEVAERIERDNEEVCFNKGRENAWICAGCKHMIYDKYDFYPTCDKALEKEVPQKPIYCCNCKHSNHCYDGDGNSYWQCDIDGSSKWMTNTCDDAERKDQDGLNMGNNKLVCNESDDLISRQGTIQKCKAEFLNTNVQRQTERQTLIDQSFARGWNACNRQWMNEILQLPPAQPERKKGKWVRITQGEIPEQYICPFCHRTVETYGVEELLSIRYPYCHCGADMRGEEV